MARKKINRYADLASLRRLRASSTIFSKPSAMGIGTEPKNQLVVEGALFNLVVEGGLHNLTTEGV